MIGLVNAAGAPEPTRVQSVFTAAQLAHDAERETLAPIVNGRQAAERLLRSAVETIEFTRAEQLRSIPQGTDSDRFDQADQEGRPTETLGEHLDVTA